MKKYIVLYRASESAVEKTKDMDPEEMKKGMEAWMTWSSKCGEGLVDIGTPLGSGQKVSSEGVTSGNSGVMGYSILQAEDMDKAVGMLKEHPHLGWAEGCEIEVHESLPMPT
jgi:hypothetical protein